MKIRFLDSGILIAAARAEEDKISIEALKLIDDPDVKLASSNLVKLEILPKAIYNKNKEEALFYDEFFQSVSIFIKIDEALIEKALEEAQKIGSKAMDALNIVTAHQAGAEEFFTIEKKEKPLFRTKLVTVKNLFPTSIA